MKNKSNEFKINWLAMKLQQALLILELSKDELQEEEKDFIEQNRQILSELYIKPDDKW